MNDAKPTVPVLVLVLVFAVLVLAAALAAGQAPPEGDKREDPIPAPPDVAAPPGDAETTGSGLASKVLRPGDGTAHPTAADIVEVHYTGWTTDGEMFDSSVARQRTLMVELGRLIPGWIEGLQLMTEGETRRMWVPEELAYKGKPDRPQGMLVFDIELIGIVTPRTPPDVAVPPEDAEVTASGLASKVLRPGTGTVHPKRTSRVKVHYSGWTTDGKMFDSSITRGQPAVFGLDQVIKGWTVGLQFMVEGEKRRFWIPEKQAYKGQKGRPQGMLVFDVELIRIMP